MLRPHEVVRIKNTHLIGRPDACLLIISDFRALAEVFDVLVNACDVDLDVAELFRIAVVDVELLFDFFELILLALFALGRLDVVLARFLVHCRPSRDAGSHD